MYDLLKLTVQAGYHNKTRAIEVAFPEEVILAILFPRCEVCKWYKGTIVMAYCHSACLVVTRSLVTIIRFCVEEVQFIWIEMKILFSL